MKKEYVKPYLALESFQLVAALAGSCSSSGKTPLNHSVHECDALDELGGAYFGENCLENLVDSGVVAPDGECYQASVEGGMYLTS